MNKPLLATLLAFAAFASNAQAVEFNTIQTDASALKFVYKQMGVSMDGRFSRFAAQISFDPANPKAARAHLDLDLHSIDAGSPEANEEVLGKAWFNAKAFPRARFVSTAVRHLGGNRYEVLGKMSIKGRTRDVAAPFTFTPQGNTATFEGGFVLKRADFAIGEGAWADFGTVANEVQIKFRFLAGARK